MQNEIEISRPAKSELANINVGVLLESIVKSGVTADAAGAVKELVLLQEHQQDRFAKTLWMEAFARVREKLKTVSAVKAVPDKSGNARWYYAPLEDLQDAVEPILATEDMTIRFDSTRDGNICTGICWLSHIGGHEENSKCAINAANAQGGDLGALKIAKRGALIAMLALKTRADGNARMLGDFVSPDMAAGLLERLRATGRSEHKFLAMAGVIVPDNVSVSFDDWKRIRQGKLGILHDALQKAEAASAASKIRSNTGVSNGPEVVDAQTGEVTTDADSTPEKNHSAAAEVPEPSRFLKHETFKDACDSLASQMKLPSGAYSAAFAKAVGAKPEKLLPSERKQIYSDL